MHWRSSILVLPLLGLFFWSTAPIACSETLEEEPLEPLQESPKAAMTGLVASATTVLPLSLSESAFADPANATTIRSALASMSAHTDVLKEYAWGKDPGFAWLARSLGQDVADATAAFDGRRYEEARFRTQRLTSNCVTCHSRLPSANDSDLGGHLLSGVDTSALHPDELAQLQLATRQFDAAAGTYEALLKEPPVSGGVGRLWYFVDYLVLSLRVLGDTERPLPILRVWAASETLPSFMKRDVRAWLSSLEALRAQALPKTASKEEQLARAREMVAKAQDTPGAPSGQQELVNWIGATALLHRVVDGEQSKSPAMAEAWYLLGVAEARIGHSPWLSQPEYYLETAVRTAPETQFAKDALAHLEWHVAVQYTGSGGENVPPEVQAELEKLRGLIDGAAKP
ncbi:MAG: hypothetical protein KDA24_17535 [Deltaproteobacteria bacterium]|nr:hypothetical protein [Deltaproteobacteria bacterium]